jgi:tetrahydromethanopterin S-methyltransferase subunit C
MSAVGGGPAGAAVPQSQTIAIGVIGGLVGIYLAAFVGGAVGSLLASLGAVAAIIWGADAIRRVASYGLGTGVPSIGYMSLAIGIVGSLAGLAGALLFPASLALAGPIMGFVIAVVVGAIVALIGRKIIKMKIPVLVQCTAELAGASALSVIGFSAAISAPVAASLSLSPLSIGAIQATVISTGFIALLFILNTMAIQHPFNACLGPNEKQTRTLKLAVSTGFISMTIVGLLALIVSLKPLVAIVPIIGAIGWLISFRAFVQASVEDAASTKWSGMWPKVEH